MWSDEFIFVSFLTVGLNTYSLICSCTNLFNRLSGVEEELSFRVEHLPVVGFASIIFLRDVAVTSINLPISSYNLNGYSPKNLSQKATCFKSLWIHAGRLQKKKKNVWSGYGNNMLSYLIFLIIEKLCRAEVFSGILTNQSKQKLDIIKLNN